MTDPREVMIDVDGGDNAGGGKAKATSPADIRAAMEAWAQASGGKIKVEVVPHKRRRPAQAKGA